MLWKRWSAAALVLLVIFAGVAHSAQEDPAKKLDSQLRVLEKEIAEVRGLAFKTPVQAKIIARPAKAVKSVQGYYSIQDKTLYLYDDLKDTYQKGVLIHEMVHALQDQHFDLGKLKGRLDLEHYDDDADLALAALIEGDATFTMIEVLKKEQPKVAGMLDASLEKSKNFHNAFLYAQGARYVKALKERGGWGSVNFAYKFPPRTTASIFHLATMAGIDLGPGPTRGAFALFKELAEEPGTRDLALKAALGWRGDRVMDTKTSKAWMIACANAESAVALQVALAKLKEAQPGLKTLKQEDGSATWKTSGGTVHGVVMHGNRVYRLEVPNLTAYQQLLDELQGPLQLTVFASKDKKNISFGEMLERLLEADLICVGESHTSDLHHRVQLQIIKGLFAYDERLGVGLEMFQHPFQKELDRHVSGESTEEAFLKASEYKSRWGYEWSLYQPIIDFCRKNRIPLGALNAPRELTARISKVGFAGLNEDEKKQLGDIDFHLKEHREYWFERLAKMHGSDKKTTTDQKERSYQVMTVWDDFMAASAARFQQERRLRRLVVLAGSGHIDRGFGIPLRAARRTGGKALTVKIEIGSDRGKEVVTDFVVMVR